MVERKDVVVVRLTVALRRVADDDNGPAQDVEVVRAAARSQLDGVVVEVAEQRSMGRPAAEYEVVVLAQESVDAAVGRQALRKRGLDVNGRPDA